MHASVSDAELEQKTAAWKLFNVPIRISLPGKFYYTDQYLAHKGLNSTSHDDAINMMEAQVNTVATPQRIAELYHEGADICFLDANGGEIVYKLVTEHINDWYRIVCETIVDVTPPINDLFLLDDLARQLHGFAVQRELDRMHHQGHGSGLRGQSFFRLGNRLSSELNATHAKPYRSLISAIINRVGANRGAY